MTAYSIDNLPPSEPIAQRLCDTFLRNRWDFISAQRGEFNPFKLKWNPNRIPDKPEWRTERRYPMKSRVLYSRWLSITEVLGVRFNHQTAYGLIDIDAGSQYHPSKNPNAIAELKLALETIGIVRTVLVRSSDSDGLHLYFPLSEDVKTFDLAVAVKFCLKSAGYDIRDGQLEIYPNDKAYGVQTKILYKGHRLPLQPATGSYLLDEDLQPGSDRLEDFFVEWDTARTGQDMAFLRKAMSVARLNHVKKPRRRLTKLDEWRRDLEDTLAYGWTGKGQTNHLLKEIGCYGVVFLELSGDALCEYIEETATNSPGYRKWCGHQREIKKRSRAWAIAVEKYYWPLHSRLKSRAVQPKESPNELRSLSARERISAAVAALEKAGNLPARPTARLEAIRQGSGGSKETLYRYKELWHPEHIETTKQPVLPVTEAVTAIEPPSPPKKEERRKPHPVKKVRTSPRVMKCGPLLDEVSSKKNTPLLPLRGVKGGQKSFPQVKVPLKLSLPKRPLESVPLTSNTEKELTETIDGIRTQAERLNWNYKQLAEFISQRFEGKRRSQLRDSDLISLLYYLQNEGRDCSLP